MKKQKGFTLIEMMIVVAIIGMLATLIIVSVTSALKKAKNEKMKTDAQNIVTQLNLYYSKNMSYPAEADWTADLYPAYMEEIPVQDNGDPYGYSLTGPAGSEDQNCKVTYTKVDGGNEEVKCKQ